MHSLPVPRRADDSQLSVLSMVPAFGYQASIAWRLRTIHNLARDLQSASRAFDLGRIYRASDSG
jgi:hypothetical protein